MKSFCLRSETSATFCILSPSVISGLLLPPFRRWLSAEPVRFRVQAVLEKRAEPQGSNSDMHENGSGQESAPIFFTFLPTLAASGVSKGRRDAYSAIVWCWRGEGLLTSISPNRQAPKALRARWPNRPPLRNRRLPHRVMPRRKRTRCPASYRIF